MKIQSINSNYNQNNISHKAHFKVNNNFEKLYKEQCKHSEFNYFSTLFKETLPKHEIEITQLKDIARSEERACEFVNNTTKQVYNTIIPCRKEGLLYLTSLIGLMKQDTFFKGVGNKEYDCLDVLTKE